MSHTSPRAEAERRKAEALNVLAARREVFIRRGRRALVQALLAGDGTATADDVRAVVELPPNINPKLFGAVPSELATLGIIEPAGWVKSIRPEAHARPLQQWKLVDRAAALQWLAVHPDLPTPTVPPSVPVPNAAPMLFDNSGGAL